MNDIKFNKPQYINGQYVVYLDSENKFSFKNKRAAEDFIRKIARESEKTLLMIAESLNDLQSFYNFYALADTDFRFRYLVNSSIDFIKNRLAWISEHTGSENHDAIVFAGLIGCIKELQTALAMIEEKAAERKDTITKRRCALKIEILKLFSENLLKVDIKPNRLVLKKSKQI